jgi:predicted HicB family RNase H-like nuclease
MNEITCSHGNGPECSKCEALDIPEVEELERELRARIADLEAERDAAKAGEARAVEALRKLNISARLAANYADDLKDPDDAWTEIAVLIGEVRGIREVLDSAQPALAWLAQREREAVVAELRDWAERWWESYSDFSAGDFNQRIAAVTTQQPTACPREEK